MNEFQKKVDASIEILRKGEKLALLMQPEQGYYVGFSGGKDSQVVLELAKMAGVKFVAVYNNTTIDPPDNVYFIRDNYPEVIIDNPKENFFKLVRKKGLPTRLARFCCQELKERGGVGSVVLTGVRKEESRTRANYSQLMKKGRRKEDSEVKDIDKMQELNFQCVNGNDKFMLYPILEWTEIDVWQFIAMRHLPYNPCYNVEHRVGCMFCPFGKKDNILAYAEKYPKYWELLKKNFSIFLEKSAMKDEFDTVDECLEWWVSKQSVKDYKNKKSQLKLF